MNMINPVRLTGFFRSLTAVLFAVLLSAPLAYSAPPGDQAAKDYVKGVADKAFGILQNQSLTTGQQKDHLRTLMKQEVSLDYIGKLALGRFNRPSPNASPDEQARYKEQIAEYRSLFPDYAFEKMYNLVLKDLDKSSADIQGVTPIRETDVFVNSKIIRPGKEPIIADWRVRSDASGKLKIIDVVAEGISLTVTQRDDFAAIISDGGMDKLLQSMHDLLDNHNTSTAAKAPAAKKTR
jgi:phospholipid transport system substrate-binding protein